MIRFDQAAVRVEDHRGEPKELLAPVDLELTEPRVAVIGANGSGKSTLLRLINGLVTPSSGRVEVAGLDVARDPRAVRRKVGFIFTDPMAQLVMSTPVEDIELSLRRSLPKKAERRERALHLLAEHGLADAAHQSIHELSGGERQLVSLTTVIAVDPEVVVADEPTTLLDLRNRNRLHRVLTGLRQQLIVSTHDLELAAACDRVIVIDDGRVRDDGTPDRVLPAYREAVA